MRVLDTVPLTPLADQIADVDRSGDWTQTWTGRRFWPLEPKPGDFCLEDIAMGLSNECRFGGQARFYSVAQHSLMVMHFVDLDTRGAADGTPEGYNRWVAMAWALIHDAAEAYMKDIPRPHKKWWGAYVPAEIYVQEQIAKRFGLPVFSGDAYPMPEIVKDADNDALRTEAGLLYPPERLSLWTDLPGRDRAMELPASMYDARRLTFTRMTPEEGMDRYLAAFKKVLGDL